MKIKIIDCSGYCGMSAVSIPAEVNAVKVGRLYYVNSLELVRVGCDSEAFGDSSKISWPFTEFEIEVIHES